MLIQLSPQLRRLFRQYLAPDHDDDVACRQSMLLTTKTLPEQAFQRISLGRFLHLLACDRKSKPRCFPGFVSDQNGHTGVASSKVIVKNSPEFVGARQSQLSRKRLADRIAHVTA